MYSTQSRRRLIRFKIFAHRTGRMLETMVEPEGILPRSNLPRHVAALNAKPGRALDRIAGIDRFTRVSRSTTPLHRSTENRTHLGVFP